MFDIPANANDPFVHRVRSQGTDDGRRLYVCSCGWSFRSSRTGVVWRSRVATHLRTAQQPQIDLFGGEG